MSISLPTNPSVVVTVPAKDGLATFSGLTLPALAQGGTIQATASGLKGVGTAAVKVTPPNNGGNFNPPAPTIIGQSVMTLKKTNKKGKPVGKAVFGGFNLVFSTAMNPSTAGLAADYEVDAMTTKRVKKKTVAVFKPVNFTVAYRQSNNTDSVTLTIKSARPFAKGGQITILASSSSGVSSQAGVLLNSSYTFFTISANAKRITLA